MAESKFKIVSLVRRTESDEIIDALLAGQEDIGDRNLSAELLEKWPPFNYYVQTIITSNLPDYFSGDEIQEIEKFAHANTEGLVLNQPPALRMTWSCLGGRAGRHRFARRHPDAGRCTRLRLRHRIRAVAGAEGSRNSAHGTGLIDQTGSG